MQSTGLADAVAAAADMLWTGPLLELRRGHNDSTADC